MNISRRCSISAIAAAVLFCSFSAVQAPSQTESEAAKPVLQTVTRFEDNLMALAKAIPADKYSFAPNKDQFKPGSAADFATVRTVAQQFTHVVGMPFRMLAPFGVKPDTEIDLKSLNTMTSKDDVLKALQASFDYQNKVIATLTPENAFAPKGPRNATLIGTLMMMLNDYGDHYGQLVEYGRMNGIIPPTTEHQMQMHHEAASKM